MEERGQADMESTRSPKGLRRGALVAAPGSAGGRAV
jgi:hypothetical protein